MTVDLPEHIINCYYYRVQKEFPELVSAEEKYKKVLELMAKGWKNANSKIE
jgi:iron-sulfur cluster repair protein YtfE (RIC family)